LGTISPNSSLRDALVILISKNIRRLPVVDNNENLVGIITDKDIYTEIAKSEAFIAGLLNEEFLRKYTQRLEQPWIYSLGEILHKRLSANAEPREKFSAQ
jgi:CBS-domain-containing membrane protein